MVKDPSIETFMPAGAARLRELFQRLDPNFAKLSSTHLSRLLSRPGLDARTRLLVLTGQYAITGRHDQLGETIEAALDSGVPLLRHPRGDPPVLRIHRALGGGRGR